MEMESRQGELHRVIVTETKTTVTPVPTTEPTKAAFATATPVPTEVPTAEPTKALTVDPTKAPATDPTVSADLGVKVEDKELIAGLLTNTFSYYPESNTTRTFGADYNVTLTTKDDDGKTYTELLKAQYELKVALKDMTDLICIDKGTGVLDGTLFSGAQYSGTSISYASYNPDTLMTTYAAAISYKEYGESEPIVEYYNDDADSDYSTGYTQEEAQEYFKDDIMEGVDNLANYEYALLLTPGRNHHSEAERNSQFEAKRIRQCISSSFLS